MPKQAVSPRAPSSPASVTSPRSAVPSGATYADARVRITFLPHDIQDMYLHLPTKLARCIEFYCFVFMELHENSDFILLIAACHRFFSYLILL
jgi:hypothetical protein